MQYFSLVSIISIFVFTTTFIKGSLNRRKNYVDYRNSKEERIKQYKKLINENSQKKKIHTEEIKKPTNISNSGSMKDDKKQSK
jgi:hypothetical protein